MAAIDSLLDIIDLQKADGIVIAAGRVPVLLGGKSAALTMPPLDNAMMHILLEELLTADERAALLGGGLIERPVDLGRGRRYAMTARLESGRTKIVVRKGDARGGQGAAISARPAPAPRPESNQPAPSAFALPDAVIHALDAAVAMRASDVILSAGKSPVVKRNGRIEPVEGAPASEAELQALVASASPEAARRLVSGSVDFALEHQRTRFRVNVFRQLEGLAAVLRPIWDEVPTLEGLGLPRALLRAIGVPNGLVLMAGATGSGKSTTLAALVEHVANTRPCHIITLEDPIEYVFRPRSAVVHQREIGSHVESFAAGLRAALRESPDVLLVGEMRDAETIALALTAAETGHLVLSTLHAGTAAGAVERMVNSVPEGQRGAVRAQIASALRFVLTQQLLPASAGGRVPAVEVLAVNYAVAAQIREGRTQLLNTQIELGSEEGMVTMDQALIDLVKSGRISRQTGLAAAVNREAVERGISAR
jgi:twitching motility protein PilT